MEKAKELELLRYMMLSRKFEENVQYYFSLGMIHGTTHLGIGEEAVASGTCRALAVDDVIFVTHRGHSAVLCKGMDPKSMMAEIFGRVTGICKGRGGSMHLADVSCGVMGSNGIVGPTTALACGAAMAFKKRGEKRIAVAFLGDGATNEGIFHEAMNLASLWRLPVLFMCVNNTYGMSTHISKAMRNTDLEDRAKPFRMRSFKVDGNSVEDVFNTVKEAKKYMLDAGEPAFVVASTYRISGHSKSDGNLYRTKEEIQYWKQLDPIKLYSEKLIKSGSATEEEIRALDAEADAVIGDAVKYAIESPYPKVEDIYEDVYA